MCIVKGRKFFITYGVSVKYPESKCFSIFVNRTMTCEQDTDTHFSYPFMDFTYPSTEKESIIPNKNISAKKRKNG